MTMIILLLERRYPSIIDKSNTLLLVLPVNNPELSTTLIHSVSEDSKYSTLLS